MFNQLRHQYTRARYKNIADQTPLSKLYDEPFQDKKQAFLSSRFMVVDCEMSGLDPDNGHLLSIGWVEIENGYIQAASAKHLIINATDDVGESVLIHGLHDHMIAGGEPAAKALALFAKSMLGSILVFHHAPIDLRFLQVAALEQFKCPLLFSYIDTLEVEKQRLRCSGKHDGLRLQQCRSRYGLPDFPQHNALNDAQATAELFIAQAHHRGAVSSLALNDFPLRCSS